MPGQWNQRYEHFSDDRKAVQLGVFGFNSWKDEGDTRFHEIGVSSSFRPFKALAIRLNPFFTIR
ncbi:hypothetical protein L0337_13535 [candidate division KSB1 bacterium]|nr:hypothetical protein [candidate division KSB1 bacterium]